MQVEELIDLIQQNKELTLDALPELDALTTSYPWFVLPRQLRLKLLYEVDRDVFDLALPSVAVYTVSRKQLYEFVHAPKPDIDTFIEQPVEDAAEADNVPEKDELKAVVTEPPVIFDQGVLDYFSLEGTADEEKEKVPALSTNDLLDRFIAANPRIVPQPAAVEPSEKIEMATSTDGIASEMLANIYIGQGMFDKAVAVYKELSLQNPKKRAYFATLIKETLEKVKKQ